MKLTKNQVEHVGKLSNLPLSDEELEKYSEQLSEILNYIDQLNSVDTKGVEPTFNTVPEKNVLREDITVNSLTQEEALSNASKKTKGLPVGRQGYFVTKGMFKE